MLHGTFQPVKIRAGEALGYSYLLDVTLLCRLTSIAKRADKQCPEKK
jgi:hypothetical protein